MCIIYWCLYDLDICVCWAMCVLFCVVFHMSSAAAVHPYGTRRSHNLPNPCRGSLPVHDDDGDQLLPVFPPQHVVLHDDDATSKVFLAIGRAFLSVVRLLSFSLSLPPSHRLTRSRITAP